MITERKSRLLKYFIFAVMLSMCFIGVAVSIGIAPSDYDAYGRASVVANHINDPSKIIDIKTEDVLDKDGNVSVKAGTSTTNINLNSVSAKDGSYYTCGDFYSGRDFLISSSTVDVSGNSCSYTYNSDGGSTVPGDWYCDLKVGDNLKYAILDPFINVRISWCIRDKQASFADGQNEQCTGTLAYYSGNYKQNAQGSTTEPEVVSTTGTTKFKGGAVSNTQENTLLTFSVNNVSWGDDAFLRLSLNTWEQGGSYFSMAWNEMYIKVVAEMATTGRPEIQPYVIGIFDPTCRRQIESMYTTNAWKNDGFENFSVSVKKGDVIIIKNIVKLNGVELNLPKTNDPSDPNAKDYDGYFFTQLYQNGSTSSPTFLKYNLSPYLTKISYADLEKKYNDSLFENRAEYTDFINSFVNEAGDLADDYSGNYLILQVTERDIVTTQLNVDVSLWRKDGYTTGIDLRLKFNFDKDAPNKPELLVGDKNFADKYIGVSGKAYYTDKESYVTQRVMVSDGVYEDRIIGVDLCKGTLKPDLTPASYATKGSTLYIYYRALNIENIPRLGETSQGFAPSAGELLCTVDEETQFVTYNRLYLNLLTEDSSGKAVFNQIGNFSIEFMAVDEVGNYIYYEYKRFIKVDVADYVFDCSLVLGTGIASGNIINFSEAQPSFATIKDDGTLSSFVDYNPYEKVCFKRGEKVVVKVTFTSSSMSKYIFTGFKTSGSGEVLESDIKRDPTNNNSFLVESLEYIQGPSVQKYTFGVDAVYSKPETELKLTFNFKMRAFISVVNTTQVYTGSGLKVIPTVKDGVGADANVIVGNIRTYYLINGEYVENFPVNVGSYPFMCVLNAHSTYFATTESDGQTHVLNILPATPVIDANKMTVNVLDYGQSLADVDFHEVTSGGQYQNFNTAIKYVDGSKYFYDRSVDDIIGYFKLDFDNKNSPEYVLHDAGVFTVPAVFVPIKSIDGKPLYDGIKFQRDNNYNEVRFELQITIRKSTEVSISMEDEKDGVITKVYNGGNQILAFDVFSTMQGAEYNTSLMENAFVTYENSETNEVLTGNPRNAGEYKVTISLRSTVNKVCNYEKVWEYILVVEKQKVNVDATDLICDFQYEKSPEPVCTDFAGNIIERIRYNFTYYRYDGEDYESVIADPEKKVGDEDIFELTNAPFNAGNYLVKIEINDANYENANDAFCLLRINTVSSNSQYLTSSNVIMPTLKVVEGGNLRYFQPLSMVQLVINSDTKVSYPYHEKSVEGKIRYELQEVSGEFIVSYREYRAVGHAGETVQEFLEDIASYRFESTGWHKGYICFIATGKDAQNFNPVCRETSIEVGQAMPDCSEIRLSDITYLTVVNSIDVFNPIVGNVRFKIDDDTYISISPDDEEYGYTFSLASSENVLYSAGTQSVAVNITNKNPNIATIAYPFIFEVCKYELDIELVKDEHYNATDGKYHYAYGNVTTPDIKFNQQIDVRIEITYFDENEQEIDLYNLDVGNYSVRLAVSDRNYGGEVWYSVAVEKAQLRSATLPSIYEVQTAVSYNRLMSEAVFSSGIMEAYYYGSNVQINGNYYFDYPEGTRFLATGKEMKYYLRFKPEEEKYKNYYEYDKNSDSNFCLTLTVAKADLSDSIVLEQNQEYFYGDLVAGFEITDAVRYSTPILKNEFGEYAEDITEGYYPLDGTFTTNFPTSGIISAGNYSVTFRIDDPNYQGTRTLYLRVQQKYAEIVVNELDKVVNFNNMNQSIKCNVVSDGNSINEYVTQIFYLDGVRLTNPPSLIGRYTVVLSLRSNNYYAEEVTADFTIRVDESLITVSNTEQVYSVSRHVSAVIRLIEADYEMTFVDKLTDDPKADETNPKAQTYETLPTNAGEYWIKLYFPGSANNGYDEVIFYQKPLIIEKYTATITASDTITVSYGSNNNLRISTIPYGLNYIVEYQREGNDEYTFDAITDANTDNHYHTIRVTVVDSNYRGEKIINFRIEPVALREEEAPVFNSYAYNDSNPPEAEFGSISFNGMPIDGRFYIEINDVNTLAVGMHKVDYYFEAIKDGKPDTNFRTFKGTTTIEVVKREISAENIVIGTVSGTNVAYNGQSFAVDAYIKSGVVFDLVANADLSIMTYYNGQIELPKEPGEYQVTAEISSNNYFGSKSGFVFVITKGTPDIVELPIANTLKVFSVGDTFTTYDLQDGVGIAKIVGTDTVVRGDFVVDGKTFYKANLNDVTVTFVPHDDSHFNSVTFSINVTVKGTSPFIGVSDYGDWDGIITVADSISDIGGEQITISALFDGTPYYGVTAEEFSLVIESVSGKSTVIASLLNFGMLYVSDNSYIPDVGGKIEVTFAPIGDLADNYDIVHGYLPVSIQKTKLDAEIEFVSYEGSAFADSNIIVKVGDKVVDIAGTMYLYDGDILVSADTVLQNKTYNYRFVMSNYTDIVGEITVVPRIHIDENNIKTDENLTKSFDGQKISVSDLGIRIINVDTIIEEDNISILSYIDGIEAIDFEPGEYTVIIRIDTGVYYGEKTVLFVITKTDISHEMELNFYSYSFGTAVAPSLMVGGELFMEEYNILYKPYGASDAFYNGNLPDNAGKYQIKVTVDTENCFGETVFDFTVEPKRITVIADAIYSYDYGFTVPPIVSFKEAGSETPVYIDYGIYYYSSIMTIGQRNVLPINAGVYTARVIPDDTNYALSDNVYAEFTYVINQLSVVIRTMPTAFVYSDGNSSYHLKYGQMLSELAFSGGVAKYNDETVEGRFTVKNPSVIPEAGEYVAEIEFIPYNSNYSTASDSMIITVSPADAEVSFSMLQASYTGTSNRNKIEYTVQPSGVRVRIEFLNAYGEIVEPINAGGYTVAVTSLDKNYRVTSSKALNGNPPVFVVAKASVREVLDPRANPITVGDNLNKSTLTSGNGYGKVFYYGFNNAVSGKFTFVERALTFKNAGTYTVSYIFTPTDDLNYATYTGTTEVVVNKAIATISVSNTYFVYSEGFKYPTFKTNPEGLSVNTDITFNEYDPSLPTYIYKESDIVDVGVYYFYVWVEDSNYYSERLEFSIEIDKKEIDMDFVDAEGNTVLQYLTTYGKSIDAKLKIYPAGTQGKVGYLLKDEKVNGVRIDEVYEVTYESAEQGKSYNSHVPPSNIGVYTVTISLRNKNYNAKRTTIYKIETGKIEEIYFDTATMENQVYGSVVAPIITTSPANVSYYIIYQGYDSMPTDAGSYHITVYFNDDNFEKTQSSAMFKINKKPITVTDIAVQDKAYDGTSSLEIEGKLTGVLFNDEVTLRMTASTLENAVSVGSHHVDITSYSLVGLQANNYELATPVYYGKINIYAAKINSSTKDTSFITSATGFDDGMTVEFNVINSESQKTSVFEKVTGRDSMVMGYTVKVNGADTIVKDTFKVYMAIPEEYKNLEFGKDFKVEGMGSLEDVVVFTREGDYITFYASASGQVCFKKTEFKYEFVVIVAAIAIAIIGIIVLIIINPMQRRSKVSGDAEKEAIKRIKSDY